MIYITLTYKSGLITNIRFFPTNYDNKILERIKM